MSGGGYISTKLAYDMGMTLSEAVALLKLDDPDGMLIISPMYRDPPTPELAAREALERQTGTGIFPPEEAEPEPQATWAAPPVPSPVVMRNSDAAPPAPADAGLTPDVLPQRNIDDEDASPADLLRRQFGTVSPARAERDLSVVEFATPIGCRATEREAGQAEAVANVRESFDIDNAAKGLSPNEVAKMAEAQRMELIPVGDQWMLYHPGFNMRRHYGSLGAVVVALKSRRFD